MAEKDPVQEVMEAFEEFKRTNDQNVKKWDDNLEAKLVKINAKLDTFEGANQKLTLAEQQNKAMQEQMDRMEAILNRPDLTTGDASAKEAKEHMAAFDRVMRKPAEARDAADVDLIKKRQAALVKGDDVSAGYLLAPPDMQKEILKNIIEMTPIRALATVRTIGGPSLKRPRKTGSGAASRIGETQKRVNTGDQKYGMLEIQSPEMYSRGEISVQMMEDSDYDLVAELREDSAEQFALREGQESISGTGVGQFEGIMVNPDVGFGVSGNASDLTPDGLIDFFYSLKTAYARNAMWGLNRLTIARIRKMKDTQNQYLWAPGIANGAPNTILGAPYAEMPDMPNIGANAFPIVFGDFRKAYIIVDKVGISFQPDYMTGADDGLVIFRSRKRCGAGIQQAEAIRKLKVST